MSHALEELVGFTRMHFDTEETLMTRHAYPDYEQHRKEHEALLEDVGRLLQRFREGDVLIPFAIEPTSKPGLSGTSRPATSSWQPSLTRKGFLIARNTPCRYCMNAVDRVEAR